jgi:membrane protein required for beta-lactamase induction
MEPVVTPTAAARHTGRHIDEIRHAIQMGELRTRRGMVEVRSLLAWVTVTLLAARLELLGDAVGPLAGLG